ncbi:hypothetical protein E8E11_002596 [Didymella keratinophila]|nr:hypothetical protein E8E11_002596 [Didymella keratinophila]
MPSATQSRTFLRSITHHFVDASKHPSSPNPITTKAYPAQYRVMFRRVAKVAAFFLPGYLILLGWPLIPPMLFNGHMYGLGREPWVKVEGGGEYKGRNNYDWGVHAPRN